MKFVLDSLYTPHVYDMDTQACTHMHPCAYTQYTHMRHTRTCTHQHVYKCMHTCTHTRARTHMCTCTFTYIHTHSHARTCIHMHTHSHARICTHIHTQAHTHVHEHAHTRTHTLITLMPYPLLFPFQSCQLLFLFPTILSLTSNLFVFLGDQDCQCDHEFGTSLGEARLNVLFGVSTEAPLSSQQPGSWGVSAHAAAAAHCREASRTMAEGSVCLGCEHRFLEGSLELCWFFRSLIFLLKV